jgi:hypothetical protein
MTGGLRTGLAAISALAWGDLEIGDRGAFFDVLRFRTSVATTWSPLPLLANVELESLTLCGMMELDVMVVMEEEVQQ